MNHYKVSNQFIDKVNSINFLFIDGDHSIEGCDYDFTHFDSKVKHGGYIAFHDFDANKPDLAPTWVINNKILTNKTISSLECMIAFGLQKI